MLLNSLRTLVVDQLQELYLAEMLIEQSLERLEIRATAPELKAAFHQHRSETRVHTQRLDKVFEHLSASPRGGRAPGLKGLLSEAEDRMGQQGEPDVIDAGLIACVQQVEHWEIAAYGTAHAYVLALDHPVVADLLAQTLAEEKETDAKLSRIAQAVTAAATRQQAQTA
jgi:ferritin-like metal-binding protein YciE